MKLQKKGLIALVGLIGVNIGIAQPQISPGIGKEKVTQLIKQALPDAPGHNAMMVIVDYLPGQASIPHRHPGSVFAYVLQGSVISQLEGQKPITYHRGQFWYEPPQVGHLMCKNASLTQPAELIVWQLLGDDDPSILLYKKEQ